MRPRTWLYGHHRVVLLDPQSFLVGLAVGAGAVLGAVALVSLRLGAL